MKEKITILLVEDVPSDAELVIRVLKKANLAFDIHVVESKTDFEHAIGNMSFDIILSDHSLPFFDSHEALRLIKEAGLSVPFILITSAMTDEFAVQVMREGAQDYMLKDRLQRLPSAVINSIEQHRLRQDCRDDNERRIFHLENTPLGYIEWDSQFNIKSTSKRTEEIFGCHLEELLIFNGTGCQQDYESNSAIYGKIAEELIAGNAERSVFEHCIINKEGDKIWCQWFNSVMKGKNGEVLTIVSLIQDITDRRKAEQKLHYYTNSCQQAINDLRKIMDSSLDVICSIDENGRFTSVSSASESVWGYKPSELVGRKYMDLVFDEDNKLTINAAAQVVSGISVTMFENRYTHKNGKIVPTLWSARWDVNDRLMYCIAKDATEKKKLEDALESERRRFYELFLQAPSCMGILKGPNHVFEMANPLYLQLIGRKDIIGRSVKEIMPEVADQGFIELLDNVFRTGDTFSANEMLIEIDKQGDGELIEIYLNFIYQAYKNNEGEIDGIFFFAIDVSEQVLSRKKVEASEKKYRQIVETTHEGIWMIDKDNKTTFVNTKLCEILGYTASEMTGKDNTFFMDEKGKEIASAANMLRIPGKAEKIDISLLTKSGSKVWVTLSGSAILDENGQYNGGLSMVTDITEKKITEEKLARKQSRLNEAQAIAHLGSWELNFSSNEGIWSDEACRIFGLSIDDNNPSYEKWLSFVYPDDLAFVLAANNESSKTLGNTTLSHRIKLKDGTIKHIDSESKYEFDHNNKPIGLYGIVHDVTERKISEENLKESESNLKEAQAIAQMGNWVINMVQNSVVWSDGLYKILGTDKGLIVPSTESFLAFIHPDDFIYAKNRMDQAFETLQDSSYDFRFVRKDGITGYAYIQWRFEFDKKQHPVRFFGIVQDITDRKEAEIERTNMVNDLMIHNKGLEQFSYIVSHNLRAPVANIIGASSGLLNNEISAESKALLNKGLYESVLKLDNVVKDLNHILQVRNDFSGINEKIYFSSLVDDIKSTFKKIILREHIDITYDFTEIDEFFTLESYLYSIFYHIISNSIKYRQLLTPCVIKIKSVKTNNKVALIFSDNGIGFDLDNGNGEVVGLYKRFHLNIKGKGMGLFMAKTQIEALGGKLTIKSAINKGTDIKIEFEEQS